MSTDLVRADLLARLEQGGAITVTSCDLRTRPDLTFAQFASICALIGPIVSAVRWWAGDLTLFGENVYGEAAAQALEELRMSPEGLAECARVAAAFPPSKRSAALSFGHHRVLAGRWLDLKQRSSLLEQAERERLSVRELEAIVRERREVEAGLHVEDVKSCEDDFEDGARSLRELVCSCFGPVAVEILVRAPGIEFRVEIGGDE
jgi:hypothetical protein